MKFITLALMIISLVSCNEEEGISTKIVDGRRASSARPWMVYLTNDDIRCGGSLYTKSLVITAAHCHDGPTHAWRAHLNRYNLGVRPEEEGASVHRVLQIVDHPNWNRRNLQYDVSVWWIESKSDERTALKLDDGTELLDARNTVTIMGWGHTNRKTGNDDTRNGTLSNILMEARVPLVGNRKCMSRYPTMFKQDIMMCTGFDRSGPSICQGDSSGPIFRNKGRVTVLMGIVSFRKGCGYKNFYGVNAKISNPSITKFINKYARKFTRKSKGSVRSISSEIDNKNFNVV